MELARFALLLVPMFGFMALGVPIFFSMGLACIIYAFHL